MNSERITDFRELPDYAHYKLRFPAVNEDKLAHYHFMKLSNANSDALLFLSDGVRGNIKQNERYEIPHFSGGAHGVYEIRLQHLRNVQKLRFMSESCGLLYEYDFTSQPVAMLTESFTIPLAFPDARVKYYFATKDSSLSFIPVCALVYDRLYIELNSDAEADISLGLVYTSPRLFKRILKHTHSFFVNGRRFYAHYGRCQDSIFQIKGFRRILYKLLVSNSRRRSRF